MTALSLLAPPSLAAADARNHREAGAACSNATLPPSPVDSSEVPPPGEPTPDPLPVPDEPPGGERMGACGVVAPPQAPPPPPEVGAKGWVVAELGSGDVLAARNPHGRYRPASVIKILTALVAVRELELSDEITATRADAATEGSSVGLEPGVTYTARQVLTGLILQSGNDAAHALARELGGRRETVRRMNELARRLGATDTRAATVSGLDGPGMSTSAYDLALILRAAMANPEFAEIASTRRAELPTPPGQPPLRIASDSDVAMNYPGALFGKTGFTDDARHTRVVAAERGGHRLVAVLLRGEHRPVEMSEQAAALLDHGFRLTERGKVGELAAPRTTTSATPDARRTAESPRQAAGSDESRGIPPVLGFLGTLLAALAVLTTVVLHRRKSR
ncbi:MULTISPECIES: D-alanyl-D-alanine carboxypeptidase family protein [unclassified Actinopolyspora]|uniref:D-alanyl-D-alanine carboxypeptidase family protein n=1 Tax=unclassified Actinopolyspora TaxID=2639451 RepID=UPI001A998036|nr:MULTISPECIES: D-alanyl-D-alanine carboxypeptidase family protein [unclassified Actinopolyspora]